MEVTINLTDEQVEQIKKQISSKEIENLKVSPYHQARELFLELFKCCNIAYNLTKYPNSIFYFKNNEIWFEIEKTDKHIFWCHVNKVWMKLEDTFNLSSGEVSEIISDVLKEKFATILLVFVISDEKLLKWKEIKL